MRRGRRASVLIFFLVFFELFSSPNITARRDTCKNAHVVAVGIEESVRLEGVKRSNDPSVLDHQQQTTLC